MRSRVAECGLRTVRNPQPAFRNLLLRHATRFTARLSIRRRARVRAGRSGRARLRRAMFPRRVVRAVDEGGGVVVIAGGEQENGGSEPEAFHGEGGSNACAAISGGAPPATVLAAVGRDGLAPPPCDRSPGRCTPRRHPPASSLASSRRHCGGGRGGRVRAGRSGAPACGGGPSRRADASSAVCSSSDPPFPDVRLPTPFQTHPNTPILRRWLPSDAASRNRMAR